MPHIRVSEATKQQLNTRAETQATSVNEVLANLLAHPQFPLNAAGDYTKVWGHPLIAWRNGTLYICEHGYPLILLPNGQHLYLTHGHECQFRPKL